MGADHFGDSAANGQFFSPNHSSDPFLFPKSQPNKPAGVGFILGLMGVFGLELRQAVSAEIVRLAKGWTVAFCQMEASHLLGQALASAKYVRTGP
jgi:hypothetical protein